MLNKLAEIVALAMLGFFGFVMGVMLVFAKNDKIFYEIVSFVPIFVMNIFRAVQNSTKMIRHYKTMLSNSSSSVCHWMSRKINADISTGRHSSISNASSLVREFFSKSPSWIPIWSDCTLVRTIYLNMVAGCIFFFACFAFFTQIKRDNLPLFFEAPISIDPFFVSASNHFFYFHENNIQKRGI